MASTPTKEGHIPFPLPSVSSPCSTYYKLFGSLPTTADQNQKPPIIILHGGPAAGHEYMLPFAALWSDYNFPVLFYDQIGCASSTHLPEKDGNLSFWTEDLFISELSNLISFFKLDADSGPGYHILGQSWGGSLAAAFAARRPKGLQRLVLASGLPSKELSLRGRMLARQENLPEGLRRVLDEGDAKDDRETTEYKEAMGAFFKLCACRVGLEGQMPEEMGIAQKNIGEAREVGGTMNGTHPWKSTGTMENWTCIPRLHSIAVPTLVYNGEHDTSHDIAMVPFFELIPRVRWITLQGAGHASHLEGEELRAKTMKLVGEFLVQGDEYTEIV